MATEYELKNVDRLDRTGLNGWVSFNRRKAFFCARMNHLDYVTETEYFDGTVSCTLDGVVGNYHDQYADGGADVRSFGGTELYDVYCWAAIKFGWYHFINVCPDDPRPRLLFTGPSVVPKIVREFTDPFFADYDFNEDHPWPERNTVAEDLASW